MKTQIKLEKIEMVGSQGAPKIHTRVSSGNLSFIFQGDLNEEDARNRLVRIYMGETP